MGLAWKPNRKETKRSLTRWWNRKGPAVGMWGAAMASRPHDVVPLPDAIGGKGVYVLGPFAGEEEAERVLKDVEPFR